MAGVFEPYYYLAALLFSLSGLVLADYRYRLVFWQDAWAAVKTLLISVPFFIIWDLSGIKYNIFYSGDSPYVTGWQLTDHLPVEEICFLILLCYLPLLLTEWWSRRHV
jgi:lycopene cyclase domain-containing protein